MGYRDDREALRQKVAMLEAELSRAQRDLTETADALGEHESKDVEDEAKIDALRDEVQSLRRKLGITAAPAPDRKKKRIVFAVLAAMTMLLGALVHFALSGDEEGKTPSVSESSKPASPALPTKAPSVPPPPPPPPPVDATVTFGALILEATGRSLQAGDGCLLHLDLRDGPSVAGLRLRCGAELLYDSADALGSGMEMRSVLAREVPAMDGSMLYSLTYQDHGMRSGPRAQISLSSAAQTLRVWSETGRPFSASLHLRARSFGRVGAPLGARTLGLPAEAGRPLMARARVHRRRGPVPSFIEEECELYAHAYAEGVNLDCRISLRCGAKLVYGGGTAGFNDCTFIGGVPATASDSGTSVEDGDPRMSLDWERRRMTVSDDRGADEWTVELRLEPTTLATLRGTWDGVVRAEGGEPRAATLEVGHRGLGVLRVVDEPEVGLSPWLVGLEGERPEGAVEFRFGPGFATVAARGGAGQVIELMRR